MNIYDTTIAIVGNVLTAPTWRRVAGGVLVTNFKVASTSRRLDRETNRWVYGNSLRVRVNCWRRLGEGVASSLMVGDPVVVVGRLYTREWTDENGERHITYELEATAVGHDLARGRGKFYRNRPATSTSVVETPDADARVHGQLTMPVSPEEAPVNFGDLPFDPDDFDDLPRFDADRDPMGTLSLGIETDTPEPRLDAGAPFDGLPPDGYDSEVGPAPHWSEPTSVPTAEGPGDPADDEDDGADESESPDPQDPDGVEAPRRARKRARTPVPA